MMNDLAKGKGPILVTGSTGFVGSAVFAKLFSLGYKNVVGLTHKEADLRNRFDTIKTFSKYQPSIVIHLAANVGGIGYNQKYPANLWEDNLQMGINILTASRDYGIEKLVLIGTVCSYPKNPPRIPFSEDDLFSGYPEETNAPYGIAKSAVMVGSIAFANQYGLEVKNLIFTNLYGPGDNFNPLSSHVIPALIRKFDTTEPEVGVWGTGRASRSFLHIKDATQAIIEVLDKKVGPEPINIASEEPIRIDCLAPMIAKMMGYGGEILWDHSKPDGQPIRHLNTSRCQRLLGFTPSIRLEEGLMETIKWYRENREKLR